jgi:hypothetical protein
MDPRDFFKTIGFIADILVAFSLAFDLFLKIPPSRKTTNNSGICTHLGGNMSKRGTAREKIKIWFEAHRCIVFSKKGAFMQTLPEKLLFFSSKRARSP